MHRLKNWEQAVYKDDLLSYLNCQKLGKDCGCRDRCDQIVYIVLYEFAYYCNKYQLRWIQQQVRVDGGRNTVKHGDA